MANINIDQIANEIANSLTKYEQAVQEGIDLSAEKVAKKTVKTLKQTSPENTGDYKKGWTDTKEKEFATNTSHTVHNKTDYQLTHLLEHGHAKRGGGRAEAKPHIKQAEEQAIDEFTQEVEEVIRNANNRTT